MLGRLQIRWVAWGALLLLAPQCEAVLGDEEAEALAPVAGVVVAEDGSPAVGVTVQAMTYRQVFQTTTDESGSFVVEAPESHLPGLHILARDPDDRRMGVARLGWQASAEAPGLSPIVLADAKSLLVEVTDSQGRPVAGALTGIVLNTVTPVSAETDDRGQAILRVPAAAKYQSVYAHKSGLGFDYRILDSDRHPARSPGWPVDGRATLTLGPTRRFEIRVVDSSGDAVAGLPLSAWLLKSPDEPDDFDLSSTPVDLYGSATNDEGSAVFADLPAWQERLLTFWPSGKEYVRRRIVWDPEKHPDGVVAASLARLVPLSGRVELPDGAPAAGVELRVVGAGYTIDSFHERAVTNADGTFTLGVWPDCLYMVGVYDKQWAAKPVDGFVVRADSPVDDVVFKLQPAARVHGRYVVGPNKTPVAGHNVALVQSGRRLNDLEGVALPDPHDSGKSPRPQLWRWAKTDAEGRFEFFVGPGEYTLQGGSQVASQRIAISGETEVEVEFAAPRPEKGPFTGTVVDGRTGEPVAGALVVGVYRAVVGFDFEFLTDENGRFSGERKLHPAVLHARSRDGRLAGLTEIAADDADAAVKVWPVGKATGRIVDEAVGAPAASRAFHYGVRVYFLGNESMFSVAFGGEATTDDEGRFELNGLIPGVEYYLAVDQNTFTVDAATTYDLGDLVLKKPYQPPTLEERIAQALEGDPREKYDAAKKNAEAYRQHLALILLDPQAEATRALIEMRIKDREMSRAFDHYRTVWLNAAGTAERRLAAELNIELEGASLPILNLRQADGAPIAAASAAETSVDGRTDKARLVDFLNAHAPEALDARRLLDEALADARRTDRRVLVQETAVWCGPCHLLAQFLEQHRTIWEKDYVWVRIDHRWLNSEEVLDELRGGFQCGIPWTCILDSSGEILATSKGPGGDNIGFPSGREGIDHFLAMLSQTRRRLSDDDLARLRSALEKRGGASP